MAKKSPSRKTALYKNPHKGAAGKGAFRSNIAKLEKRFGQKNLAAMLGVSPRSVRRYKEGKRKPRYDINFKLGRLERSSRGLRKTKSITKMRRRSEKLIKERPELRYFEKTESFKYSDTDHITIFDVRKSEVEDLISYLAEQDCGACFFVVSGVDKNGNRVYYSSEVMEAHDFAELWQELYDNLSSRYDLRKLDKQRIDLVGIKYNAPSPITRQEK